MDSAWTYRAAPEQRYHHNHETKGWSCGSGAPDASKVPPQCWPAQIWNSDVVLVCHWSQSPRSQGQSLDETSGSDLPKSCTNHSWMLESHVKAQLSLDFQPLPRSLGRRKEIRLTPSKITLMIVKSIKDKKCHQINAIKIQNFFLKCKLTALGKNRHLTIFL